MSAVLFISEGGAAKGLGHLRRCATLASFLPGFGFQPVFRVGGGVEACAFVASVGFTVAPVTIDERLDLSAVANSCSAQVVVVDTYSITDVMMDTLSIPTVVIDDLANRRLPAVAVINASLSAKADDYKTLTSATLLLGPRYALVRSEFVDLPSRSTEPHIGRVLVTLGGGSYISLASTVANWCRSREPNASVQVAVGPFTDVLPKSVETGVEWKRSIDMAAAMSRTDLAISAGGQTLFELAAAGVPALAVAVAENQRRNLRDFANAGTILPAGEVDDEDLASTFTASFDVVRDPDIRRAMSTAGRRLVDGRGAPRAAEYIANLASGRNYGADL